MAVATKRRSADLQSDWTLPIGSGPCTDEQTIFRRQRWFRVPDGILAWMPRTLIVALEDKMVASRIVAFGFGLALASAPAYGGRSAAGGGDSFVGTRVDKIIAQFGLPNRMTKMKHGRFAYHWRLEAPGQGEAKPGERPAEDFFCDVTVVTSPRGRVTQIKTEVSNVGAGAYAAVGAFGRLCRHRFGLKPEGAPKSRR